MQASAIGCPACEGHLVSSASIFPDARYRRTLTAKCSGEAEHEVSVLFGHGFLISHLTIPTASQKWEGGSWINPGCMLPDQITIY